MNTSATLDARAVRASLGDRLVLDGIDARFVRGWTAIVGPNGAGKSTLLRVLAGLLAPIAGDVALDDVPLLSMTARERGRRIAWLTQLGDVFGDLDARETVALGRLPHLGMVDAPGAADDAAVDRAMVATESTAWAHRRLDRLSGGERQRVLLARALATEADVLLLDEPTAHLDPPHQVALVKLARALAVERTVVTVLHDLSLALYADRIVLLHAGRVRAIGASDDPSLHVAMAEVFDHAIRIETGHGRPIVRPNID